LVDKNLLADSYNYLKNLEFAMKNVLNQANAIYPKEPDKINLLTAFFSTKTPTQFLSEIEEKMKLITNLTTKLF